MIINKKRLEKLIESTVVCCRNCPIYEVGDWTACDKYRQRINGDIFLKSCAEALLDWLQECSLLQEIPEKPDYGVPCEQDGGADCDECKFIFDCPYR